MDVGKRLRTIRTEKNVSIYRLSQDSTISESHIRNLERGTKKSTVETLELLIKALDMTPSEFFNENNSIAYLTEQEKILLQYFRTLSAGTAAAVTEFCEKMQNRK